MPGGCILVSRKVRTGGLSRVMGRIISSGTCQVMENCGISRRSHFGENSMHLSDRVGVEALQRFIGTQNGRLLALSDYRGFHWPVLRPHSGSIT